MAYDERLAERVRELVADRSDVAERKMFGGLAFLVGGHMALAVTGSDGLMLRVDPATSAALLARGPATPMVMNGRHLAGWVLVGADALRTRAQLARWVARAVDHVATLPPKAPARRRS